MTVIKVVCAWCGKDMGEKDGQGQEGVSHGMCEECGAKVIAGTWEPKRDFSKMTEGEALYSIGVRAIEKDGKKGINLPVPDKPGESIFIEASDEKPGAIVASDRKQNRVKGAKKTRCADCRRKVWISPSTQVLLKRYPGVPVICLPCFVKRERT